MRLLYQILWKDHSRAHLLWAFLGTLAGFVLLLAGIQFYIDIKSVLSENRDLLDPEYIVINKNVNIAQTLGLSTGGFSEEEIEEIAQQPFADQVSPFLSNEFPVSGYTENERFPDFYTELFFEAIPDEFIDVKSEEWLWDPEVGKIPVIIPQDYLNLYNFGFAPSQGLPQIPKGVLSMIKFKLRLQGKGWYDDYDGQIVGFSNRIHSILVPLDFLKWANDKYGYFDKSNPSQLIVVSKDPTDPSIIRFLEEKSYDTIREKLKSSRMNIILKLIISFLVVVAAIIIGLAFLVFLLSLQLMISRSSEKIRRLNKLGFHFREISRPYILLLLVLMTAVTGFSLIITSLLAGKFHNMAQEWSLNTSTSLHGIIFGVSVGLIALISLANVAAILISTKKLCK
ncbi:MAG: ABC transporter permease [Bacteroidia bacterium]|nr:MAG: ABC transporter permease [Bacteroidia bacterium]